MIPVVYPTPRPIHLRTVINEVDSDGQGTYEPIFVPVER